MGMHCGRDPDSAAFPSVERSAVGRLLFIIVLGFSIPIFDVGVLPLVANLLVNVDYARRGGRRDGTLLACLHVQ